MSSKGAGKRERIEYERRELRDLACLALGTPLPDASRDWPRLEAAAAEQRISALAWLRSAAQIRDQGGDAVADTWRRRAIGIARIARRQLRALAGAQAALDAGGIAAVVLKGPPLAALLYGDAAIRPTADVDLLVESALRENARAALSRDGWKRTAGVAPDEETYVRRQEGMRVLLEVHSTILDDPLLSHIVIPTETIETTLDGVRLRALAGDAVAPFLAAHLAKHRSIPLLWLVDFATLWEDRLDDRARARATRQARRIGLARHLTWAARLAADLSRVCGSPDAADSDSDERIARALAMHSNAQRVVRLMRLSQSPGDAVRVLRGRLARTQLPERHALHSFNRGRSRLTRRVYRMLSPERASPTAHHEIESTLSQFDVDGVLAALERASERAPIRMRVESDELTPWIPLHAVLLVAPVTEASVVAEASAAPRPWSRALLVLDRFGDLQVHGGAHSLASTEERVVGHTAAIEVGARTWRLEDRPRDLLSLARSLVIRARQRD